MPHTSRRQFLANAAQLGLLLGAGGSVGAACGGGTERTSDKLEPIKDGLAPEKGPLRIYNYADYVSADTIAGFEERYGVKVEITTFDSDSEAITKLASRAVRVDLHHSMAPNTIGRLIQGKLIRPINKSYIPNFANVGAGLADPYYDAGSAYSVPYTLFSTGIGYRADRIDAAEVESLGWDLLWNRQFKGQISIIDDYRESLAMAILRSGTRDVNTADPTVITGAGAALKELIDLVNVKVNIEGYKDVPSGETSTAHCWSADMLVGAAGYLPEGVGPEVLGFWYPPDDVGVVNNDCMGVLADAEHPVLAHLYMNHLLDLQVAEDNFAVNGYLPALAELTADRLIGKGLVPDNLRNCVPTQAQIDKGLRLIELDIAADTVWQDTWSSFTAGG
jgi:spermidine/putrescine transport system substrate-binding protein